MAGEPGRSGHHPGGVRTQGHGNVWLKIVSLTSRNRKSSYDHVACRRPDMKKYVSPTLHHYGKLATLIQKGIFGPRDLRTGRRKYWWP